MHAKKSSNVVAWSISSEYSDSLKSYYDSYFAGAYPNVEILATNGIYSTTKKFNCHSYAWHVSDGGNERWIGYDIGNTDEYIYWQDGSYVEVTGSVPYPGKVSYASDDHSAITTSESGWFISKWGNKVLARHMWNDCPYTSSNLKYYKLNFSISGSDLVCNSNTTFTLSPTPGGTTNWTKSSNLSFVGGDTGTSVTVKTVSSTTSGQGGLHANFTSGCGTSFVVSKTVWAGVPSTNEFNILDLEVDDNLLDPSEGNSLLAQDFAYPSQTISGWEWDFGDWWRYTLYSNGEIATIFPDYGFDYQDIGIRAVNGCGASDWYYETFYNWDYYSYYFSIFPNPANEYVELSVEPGSEVQDKTAKIRIEKAKGQDGLGEYTIEIWSERGGRLKTFTSKENHLQLSTSDLPQGKYFVHLIVGGKTYKQQLLIEK